MVNSKKYSRGKRSQNVHRSYPRTTTRPATTARKTIIIIIVLSMAVVILGAAAATFMTNESRVKSKVSDLASDYYENYFYTNLISSPKFKDLNSTMEKYQEHGFSTISLNELLLYDNQKNAKFSDYLTEYCDENKTFIKFYPDPPYDRKSYHIQFSYACTF